MNLGPPLPIDAVLEPLKAALWQGTSAVLVAPPGAGKTTRVPLALLDEPWLKGQRIVMLEPRRLAARGAAARMAGTLGEKVGATIGLRARLDTRVSKATRIEVVTEGVFTRMILDDPALEGIGAVLLDEFHERSLDADLALALALDAKAGLREDLRLLAMSATLDGARVAKLLGDAPVITSEGRAFPVETRYVGRDPASRIEPQVAEAVRRALATEAGSLLVFLPGQGEIRRVAERLAESVRDPAVDIVALHGGLDLKAQDRAVAAAERGRRKVVLSTAIAETSLTIEGVRVVIDSGLARVPRFEADVGITRLDTVRVSRASADQRRGRAGRTEPGVCYRLWDEPETASLAPFGEPEIRQADLTGLVLDCAEWGAAPERLAWLDPPQPARLTAAREELQALGALDGDGRITALGRRLRALPLPTRLARMLVSAADVGAERAAAEVAAVLVERGLGGRSVDLDTRVASFRRERGGRAEEMRRLAAGWARAAREGRASRVAASHESSAAAPHPSPLPASGERESTATLLALAYPDRIAKARGAAGLFVLANGRGARVDETDALARAPFLVVAELQGTAARAAIQLAAATSEAEVRAIAGDRIREARDITFDAATGEVRARRIERLDAIVLRSEPMRVPDDETTAELLADGIAGQGIASLPWSKAQSQLRDRVAFLRATDPSGWPDLSDTALAASAREWLAPFLTGCTRKSEITAERLAQALDVLLPFALRQRLDAEAPTHFTAPTGNRHAIDYEGAGAPALSIRVQELFGLTVHPAIAGGRLPLTLNLLSPAHRPIQITRDLPGFWKGSWAAVKADMKGRYPKHPWPDDPASALPTTRAKPRGT